ncbi:MAG TPA: hypothetical protein VNJ54_01405 [Plantibacter sp.]|uniref:hypothetical protein n=1 Tax=Plantibacter sp. TaxID=1871045 RepID=UPI002D03B9C9|nr:hypothetical protein [Plantibacter sp.]
MRRLALLLAVLPALMLGCSVGAEDVIPVESVPQLVLQPDDLGNDFRLFDEGRLSNADTPSGARADRDRFGRLEGWKSRYRRPGSAATAGPLVVESRVDLFASSDGAGKDLRAHRGELERAAVGAAATVLEDAPVVGEESVAVTTLQELEPVSVRYFTIAWRERNTTASVLVQGFEGKLKLEDALTLARKQQARLEGADGT